MKSCPCVSLSLCALSSLLPVVLTAGDFKVEVVTNVTQVTEGENFFIRCIVYGIPDLHFLDSSNTSVSWIFQRKNRVEILGLFPKLFQSKYEISRLKWNRTFIDNTFHEAINFTIDIYEVTEKDKGIYTCVVSKGSEVVRKNLNLTEKTSNTSLVFIDYAVSREDTNKKCSFYGFKAPDCKTTKEDLSSIMETNETVWTFSDEDRHVLIKHRQWLSIRGCYHINLTHNSELHHNCNFEFDSLDNMMGSFIGIHNTVCFVVPDNIKEFEKMQLPQSLCNWRCADVVETLCGGEEAVSLYKVINVTYKNFARFKTQHEEQCNALYLNDVGPPVAYQRITCRNISTCSFLCLQSIRNNTGEITFINKYRNTSSTEWMKAWQSCVEHNASLPDERGNISIGVTEFPCLGIIKNTHLIFKERAFGVLNKKENGSIVLKSTTERKGKFPFICELFNEAAVQRNDSEGSSTSNNIQIDLTQVTNSFNMLIIFIPTSLLGLIILLTVVICLILRLTKKRKKKTCPQRNQKTNVAMKVVKINENEEADEYDVLRQQRQTTHNNDLYNHAKGQSSGIYDVTIRDQSLLHDNMITDNLYDARIKTAVKHDESDINLYDDPKTAGRETYDNPTKLSNETQLTDNVYGHVHEN